MATLEQMYQEVILDHYRHPHGRGLADAYDTEVHHVNPTCGDEVTLRLRLEGPESTVRVSWDGQGCSISQAAASVLVDLVDGRALAEAMERYEAFRELVTGRGEAEPDEDLLEDGVAFAGVARYPLRVKCALLAWSALKDATVRVSAA